MHSPLNSRGNWARWGCDSRVPPINWIPISPEHLHGTIDVLAPNRASTPSDARPPLHAPFARVIYPPRKCSRLQPGRDVHSNAVEIIAIDNQVTEMEADPEHDGRVLGLIAVRVGHHLLKLDGRGHRVTSATTWPQDRRVPGRELDQAHELSMRTRLPAIVGCWLALALDAGGGVRRRGPPAYPSRP